MYTIVPFPYRAAWIFGVDKHLSTEKKIPKTKKRLPNSEWQPWGSYITLSKEAEVSHHYGCGKDLQLCTLLSEFLLAHLCWPLLSV